MPKEKRVENNISTRIY